VHALHTLGLSPIFLVNRDPAEVEAVVQTFPHLNLIHLAKIEDVDAHTKTSDPALVMAVGAIPAIPPSTPAERLVYTIVTHLLTSSIVVPPPTAPPQTLPSAVPTTSTKPLPFPTKRIFLDMAYKPRLTPLLRIASALGWQDVGGVQAMIEQGLAQSRMWKARNASVEVACGDGLGEHIDRKARELVEGMADVVVTEVEVDRALKLKIVEA
jgi:quinate dehydrogenase